MDLSLSTLNTPSTMKLTMMTQKMVKAQVTTLTPKPRTTSPVKDVFMRRSQSRSLTSGARRTLTTIWSLSSRHTMRACRGSRKVTKAVEVGS